MKVTDKDYYMDGYLHDNLNFMKQAAYEDDDFVLLVDGMERSGKSVMALQIAYFLDPKFSVDNIVYGVEEFQEKVINAEQYSCIVWDEAFRGLSKRQAISKVNKKVIETLMEIGQKNLFIIIVLPTFFELDKYAALHRCKCLIHIHRNNKYKRGYFKFYSYKKMKDMYMEGRPKYSYCRKADFFGRFTHAYPIDEQAYRDKKSEELKKLQNKDDENDKPRVFKERRMIINAFRQYLGTFQKAYDEIIKVYPDFTMSYDNFRRAHKP